MSAEGSCTGTQRAMIHAKSYPIFGKQQQEQIYPALCVIRS